MQEREQANDIGWACGMMGNIRNVCRIVWVILEKMHFKDHSDDRIK
jgi:hypothetical protein